MLAQTQRNQRLLISEEEDTANHLVDSTKPLSMAEAPSCHRVGSTWTARDPWAGILSRAFHRGLFGYAVPALTLPSQKPNFYP